MTSGLPQVCKLRLGVSKAMLPVKHLAPKNPHGSQLLKAPIRLKVGVGSTCLPQKKICNRTEEHMRRHKSMKNKAKKAVSKATREKAEVAFTELQNCPYGMLRLIKGLKTDHEEVKGG